MWYFFMNNNNNFNSINSYNKIISGRSTSNYAGNLPIEIPRHQANQFLHSRPAFGEARRRYNNPEKPEGENEHEQYRLTEPQREELQSELAERLDEEYAGTYPGMRAQIRNYVDSIKRPSTNHDFTREATKNSLSLKLPAANYGLAKVMGNPLSYAESYTKNTTRRDSEHCK